jgi:branched-chain amino acid transport system substrate-binding protein
MGSIATMGLAGCSSLVGDDGGPYTVGQAIPLSGDLAVFGERSNRAREFSLGYINDATIDGREVEYVVEDTNTNPQDGVSAAEKLVNQDGVPMMQAGLSSGVAIAIAESVTIPQEVLHMAWGNSPEITGLDDNGYMMRTVPPNTLDSKALAEIAIEREGVSKLGIIHVNNSFGEGFADALESEVTAKGGEITGRQPYEPGKASYSPQLNEVMNGDPEGIVFIAYPQSFATMAQEAFEMGIKDKVQYFGVESLRSSDTADNVPDEALNGIIGVNASPPDNDLTNQFLSEFNDEFDRDPDVWTGYFVDGIILQGLAIAAADEFESPALRDSIYEVSRPPGTEFVYHEFEDAVEALDNGEEINYQGIGGSADVNDAGDVGGSYVRWEYTDGEFAPQDYISVQA